MTNSQFYSIIDTEDTVISIPSSCHFSLGTSPYYAHQHGLAVDIYQKLSLENYDVLSPVSGRIIKTRTLSAPKPKFLDGVDKEHLILISNKNNPEIVYKTLHVKPKVNAGDQIEIGDVIGTTIRNGYFAYWSSPHLHLEIRSSVDAVRARGGQEFSLAIIKYKEKSSNITLRNPSEVPVEICSIFPEFVLARFPEQFYYKIDPIYGTLGRLNKLNCIIDGGVPIYKNGTVLHHNIHKIPNPRKVYMCDTPIGELHELREQLGFFKFNSLKLYLNGFEIRGMSLFLAKFAPLVKIIPLKIDEFSFKVKSNQYLSIENIDEN
jgi:murein DD-endopeptidase MepM/ murein hydrolase activator NlpD